MRDAQVVGSPLRTRLSLIATGMPSSGERTSPRARRASDSRASARAASGRSRTNACRRRLERRGAREALLDQLCRAGAAAVERRAQLRERPHGSVT
jgi:hypothetical protein